MFWLTVSEVHTLGLISLSPWQNSVLRQEAKTERDQYPFLENIP